MRRFVVIALAASVACAPVYALAPALTAAALRDTSLVDLGRLTPHRKQTGTLQGDARHAYRVPLRRGQAARVATRQQGYGLVVSIREPNGTTIGALYTPSVLVVARDSGDYAIIVELERHAGPGTRYELRLGSPRRAAPRDTLTYRAQSLYARALPLRSNAPREVLQLAGAACRLARDGHDPSLELYSLYLVGEARDHLGDFEGARTAWTRVADMALALGDSSMAGVTYSAAGRLSLRLGDIARAETNLDRAAIILSRSGDSYPHAVNDGFRAELAMQTGRIRDALALYETLLAQTRIMGDGLREGVALNDLAVAYQRAGDFDRARQLFEHALVLVSKNGDDRNVAATLHNMGVLHLVSDDAAGAIALLDESLRRRGNIDPYGRAVTLGQLGRAYLMTGHPDVARAKLQEGLSLRAPDDVAGRAFVLARLAAALAAAGDNDSAFAAYGQAIALHRQARQRLGEADATYGLARLLHSQGRYVEALERIRETIAIVESVRWSVGSRNLRAFFLGATHDYYTTEIDILMALHREARRDSFAVRAFEASERGRARTLMEFLADANAPPAAHAPAELLRQERNLARVLAMRGEQQVRLGHRPHAPEDEVLLASTLEELSRKYDRVQAEIERAAGRVAQSPRAPTLASIQQSLDDRTLLLEYSLGTERSYVWSVTRDSFVWYELTGRRDIEAQVGMLLSSWGTPTADSAAVVRAGGAEPGDADALAITLLAPVRQAIAAKRRLLIVADGILHRVPFATLSFNGRTLLDDHEVAELPSAASIAVLRTARTRRPATTKTIAVFADPVYDARDPRIAAGRPSAGGRHETAAAKSLTSNGEVTTGSALSRLPFSRMEARSILALVPASLREQVLDFDANRRTVTTMNLSQFRILHFAAHAVVRRGNPELSGIILSLVDSDGRDQAGFLSLADIVQLRTHADLVVLSACETAAGDDVAGEGVISLARAFMQAGAAGVVATLWKVDDAASAELMRHFYAALLATSLADPAAALRRAQLELRADRRWRDPSVWGAFVLLGQ